MLEIIVSDTAQQHNAMVWGTDTKQLVFNDKGVATFDSEKVTKRIGLNVYLGDSRMYTVIVEPGKKLSMTVTGFGKRATVKFKGENAHDAELTCLMKDMRPTKDTQYERNSWVRDTLSFEEAFPLLDSKYEALCRVIKKEKNADRKARLHKEALVNYVGSRCLMQQQYCERYHIRLKDDAKYQSIMAEVMPNDSLYLQDDLIKSFIVNKTTADEADDINSFANEFMATVDKEVTNNSIRRKLLGDHLKAMLKNTDIAVEPFWTAAQHYCHADDIAEMEYVYNARVSTKKGMECPDITFSDKDGNKHHLSEHFGKVLYIDLWATWCLPCCAQIPYIEKLQEHFKDDSRIEFISISIDKKRDQWLRKIEADKPVWPQYNADEEEQQTLHTQWGIQTIPRFLIINADGTINDSDAFRPSTDDFIHRITAILTAQ